MMMSLRSEKKVKRCECGGTDHVRKSHSNYPLNPRNATSTSRHALISQSAEADDEESDFEGFEVDDGEMSSSEEPFSDGIGSSDEIALDSSDEEARDTCSCKGRAHKRDCPLNPRNKVAAHKKQYAKKSSSVAVSRKGKEKSCYSEGFPCKEEANKVIT